jgi:hypothetical protein
MRASRPLLPLALCATLLSVASCTDWEKGTGTPPAGKTDADRDGFYKEVDDCDDADPEVNPDGVERVNCLDDNCNGRVDEGTIYDDGFNKTNEDRDNDGYCPSTGDVKDCEGNPRRNPAMSEDGGNNSKKGNNIDDDCDGVVDEGLPDSDTDKDGFTLAQGDCNDLDANINPAAIESEGLHCKTAADCPNGRCYSGYCRCQVAGDCSSGKACKNNDDCTLVGETCSGGKCSSTYSCKPAQQGLGFPQLNVCRDNADNDCDKKIDELPVKCDDPTKLKETDPYDFARAMEICDTDHSCSVEKKCPKGLKCLKSGKCSRVLSASFDPRSDIRSRGIDKEFAQEGPIKPLAGQAFAILSTGVARYKPGIDCPQDGTAFSNQTIDPDPKATDKTAMDYTHLELEILVPTNARSFEFDFQFFSSEYPEYVGKEFNDTFWVQLTSSKYPLGINISFDAKDKPIRINNAFFTICEPYVGLPQTKQSCTRPVSLLLGTGYVKECKKGFAGDFTVPNGGATGWLYTTSPVTPGEKIKLTFSIFDKGDHILDSAVVIDNFRWKLSPAKHPSTGPR